MIINLLKQSDLINISDISPQKSYQDELLKAKENS